MDIFYLIIFILFSRTISYILRAMKSKWQVLSSRGEHKYSSILKMISILLSIMLRHIESFVT